jgi:hypothetical protein
VRGQPDPQHVRANPSAKLPRSRGEALYGRWIGVEVDDTLPIRPVRDRRERVGSPLMSVAV